MYLPPGGKVFGCVKCSNLNWHSIAHQRGGELLVRQLMVLGVPDAEALLPWL